METPMQELILREGTTGEETVNFFERMDEKSGGHVQPFLEKAASPRSVPEGNSLSGATSPTSPRSTTGSLNPVLDATRKLRLLSTGEASPGSPSMAGSSLNRDLVLAKLNKDKTLSLIKAWEENEKKKSQNRYNKKLIKLSAWEAAKKARTEARLKTSEERMENERAACVERTRNKIALVQRIAEEERALAEAQHGQEMLKAEEVAAKCRASGSRPRKFIFCC